MSVAAVLDLDAEVCAAWTATLGEAPGGLAWEEVGGDSLATLHLLFRLEQRLGRTLSLDLMQPGMTAAGLAAALRDAEAGGASDRPCLFLVPGILGDEPGLAALRRGLVGGLRTEVVSLPGVDTPAAVLRDMAATGVAVACEIDRRQPGGRLLLGGYSFGGSVALEAAAALAAKGREVALIAVLDATFGATMLRRPPPQSWRRRAGRMLLALMSWDTGRRSAVALVDRLRPKKALAVRRRMLRRLRSEARAGWRLAVTRAPVFLVLSEEFADGEALWRALCPNCDLLQLPGDHHGLIRGSALPVLAERLERAVLAAAG